MKKIYVNKVEQKDLVFYSMVMDPRLVAKVRRKYTAGEKQDVQRPWVEKKVKEISEYVAGKAYVEGKKSLGIIPNAPIINLKGNLRVHSEDVTYSENGKSFSKTQYFILFPETESEFSKCENNLEIIDGQHRVIAFDSDYLDPTFKDGTTYEMIFSVFDNITDNQRKELFMVTNEKQDKVESNLLRYIKKSLGLLVGDDEIIYDLLSSLNKESSSPLHGRIMFGSDKIKKGYKENQLSKIFKLYGVKKFYDTTLLPRAKENTSIATQNFVIIVNNYISAWEECSNVSFQDPASDTITKISGIRYIFCIFNDICNKILNSKEKLTKDNFIKVLKTFPKALDLENIKCVFCDDEGSGSSDEMVKRGLSFRGESATVALAKDDLQKVLSFDEGVSMDDII